MAVFSLFLVVSLLFVGFSSAQTTPLATGPCCYFGSADEPLGCYTADNVAETDVTCKQCQQSCKFDVSINCPGSFMQDPTNGCYSYTSASSASLYFSCFGYLWNGDPIKAESVLCVDDPEAYMFGDPHIHGFDGTDFDFMGYKDGVFSLYSDPSHQINMLLDDFGIVDATYMREVGFLYADSAGIAFVSLPSGGFDVTVNGQTLAFGRDAAMKVDRNGDVELQQVILDNTQMVHIKTPSIFFKVMKGLDNTTKHLDTQMSFYEEPPARLAHGVLGQTLSWIGQEEPEFEGEEKDYLVDSLLGLPKVHNMFKGVRVNAAAQSSSTATHMSVAATSRRRLVAGEQGLTNSVEWSRLH